MSLGRTLLIGAGAAFVAGLIVRQAALSSSLPDQPGRAVALWTSHPDAVLSERMAAIGEAAQSGRVAPSLIRPAIEAIRRSPLAPEPFLVRGVQLREAGNERGAGAAFRAAVQREPRSVPGHFFLSDHYSRTGQTALGLTELGRLVRIVPGSSAQLAPRVAASLKAAGGEPAVRALVADNPELRDDLLHALATDAGNARLVFSLADPRGRSDWQPVLVQSLFAAGRFGEAFALWARSNGVTGTPLMPDPRFALAGKPPFGWSLASGPAEVAEAEDGGLHVLYYGREKLVAATQVLLLPAGAYQLSFRASTAAGDAAALQWQLSCLPGDRLTASIAVAPATPGERSQARFAVPTGCQAQRIELVGSPRDVPQTVDLMIADVDLRRDK